MKNKSTVLDFWQLTFRQNLPLDLKEKYSERRIREWYTRHNGEVYISFSGGKDSTVLLDLVRRIYPDVPGVFIDSGLEYPEIRKFVKTFDNIIWIKPRKNFKEVITKFGYPVISKEVSQKIYEIRTTNSDVLKNKRLDGDEKGNGKLPEKYKHLIGADFKISSKCCDILRKSPAKIFEYKTHKKPFIGTMAEDSFTRRTNYLFQGCNAFHLARQVSTPIAFWKESDIWEYIKKYDIKYSSIYDKGLKNSGCMFCLFGIHLEGHPNRLDNLKNIHPFLYKYCMEKLNYKHIMEVICPSKDKQEELD